MIYFIQTGDNRAIKIGYAGNVQQRLANLQTGSATPLKLLASMPGTVAIERSLHAKFSHLRTHREWFGAHPDIIHTALHGAQLTGITPDDDPYLAYAILDTRLVDLLIEAASIIDDGEWFCANRVFFGYDRRDGGFAKRITQLVGHYAGTLIPALRTSVAYDAVYDRIYAALPDCRLCGCP